MTSEPTAPQGERLEACPTHFAVGVDGEVTFHTSAESARRVAQDAFDGDAEMAGSDGWSDCVHRICWGELRASVVELERRAVTEEDCLPKSIDEFVRYELLDTRTPAPSPSAPIDADPGTFAEYGPHASSNEDRERVDQCGGAGQRVLRDLYAAERVLGLRDTEPSAPSPHAAQAGAYKRVLSDEHRNEIRADCVGGESDNNPGHSLACFALESLESCEQALAESRTAVATLTRERDEAHVRLAERAVEVDDMDKHIAALKARLARAMEVAEWAMNGMSIVRCDVNAYFEHAATLAAIREEMQALPPSAREGRGT